MKDILRNHSFSVAFIAILVGFLYFPGRDSGEIFRLSGYTMGTTYQIQLVELPEEVTQEQIGSNVSALLSKLDTEIFSTYAGNSELSRFNRHSINVPFVASSELIEVLQLAREVSELTSGAFDVTIGPLVNLWGFGPGPLLEEDKLPSQEQIDEALASTGFRNIQINPSRSEISKSSDLYVDLSAIAKGYAVDQLGSYFDELGMESYFLEIGGELKMKGLKPGGVSWIPAIEAPVDVDSRVYEIFFSRGDSIAVAGSGDYRNYFEVDGVRYSHELDPRTGRPVNHNLAAAYVIDDTAARADALATAFMVMGLEAASELSESEGLATYFIFKGADGDFDEFVTDSFSYYLGE